jgi:hypothetical protein
MANTLRIKRRASGQADAPSSLVNAELAFNEVNDTLYYGKGNNSGNATSIIPIGGPGAFVTLSGTSTFSGTKTLAGTVDFTGTATAVTQATGDNTTKIATTAFVKSLNYGTGSVTSVALSLPSIFTVTGSPVTGSGTLTASLASQAANHVFIAPNGSAGSPAFRALVAADIPQTLTASYITNFDTQVRTSRLDQMAAPTANVAFNSVRITNLADPVSAQDAATRAYVDSVAQGLDVKPSVRAASTASLSLTGAPGTIDGVTLADGDTILVKNQNTASQNGIYQISTAGAWTRIKECDTWNEHVGAFTFVESGTTQADTGWVCTADPGGTLGTTNIGFTQFSGAGSVIAGDGIAKAGNTLSVTAHTGIAVSASGVALTGQALAVHNLATSGMIVRTGSGTVTGRSVAASGSGVSVSNGDGVSGNPTVALSANLAAVAGVTAAADTIAYWTGASTASAATLTTFGRSLIDDANASAARTTLELGTMATQTASSVNITGGSIDNITLDGGTF